jgi:hypothetical protein
LTEIFEGDRIQVVSKPISENYYIYRETMLKKAGGKTIFESGRNSQQGKEGPTALFLDLENGDFEASLTYSLTSVDVISYIISYYQFLI